MCRAKGCRGCGPWKGVRRRGERAGEGARLAGARALFNLTEGLEQLVLLVERHSIPGISDRKLDPLQGPPVLVHCGSVGATAAVIEHEDPVRGERADADNDLSAGIGELGRCGREGGRGRGQATVGMSRRRSHHSCHESRHSVNVEDRMEEAVSCSQVPLSAIFISTCRRRNASPLSANSNSSGSASMTSTTPLLVALGPTMSV